jgi:hypothetical protein
LQQARETEGEPALTHASDGDKQRLQAISALRPALPVAKLALRSDIQPRVEACVECVSFPHISLGQIPDLMT